MTPTPPRDDTSTQVYIAESPAALAILRDRHPDAVVIATDPAAVDVDRRCWWPLLELCTDDSLAAVIAERLTAALPDELRSVGPDAAIVLTGALHAAALVGWPPVTITHLLDAGAIATIVELLSADGDEDLALCVATAAGDLAADARQVRYAAAVAARPLLDCAAAITGPPRHQPPGTGVWREVRGARATAVIVATSNHVVASLIADRLAYLTTTATAAAITRPGTPA